MSKLSKNMSKGKDNLTQVDASLDQPLDVDAPPTIYGTKVKPELCSAAMNLAMDSVKQQQSLSNKFMIKHPFTGFILLIATVIYLAPRIILPRNIKSGSITGFLYQLVHFNVYNFGTALAIVSLTGMCLFTVYSRISEFFFKTKLSEITDNSGEKIFGVDLRKLATKDKKALSSKQNDNTYIIIYREAPIALISIKENDTLSSKEALVVSISTVGCRKVYIKSGIMEDLLDWAMLRTKTINKEGNYGQSMKLLISVYSFETDLKHILKRKGFTLVQSTKSVESRLLGGLFGARKELWGIQFHFEPAKQE
ncbi:hypothetical protein HG535_0H00710 [Zygotorulaspora mrakii]|uniref:Inorganic phosphate transporter PHO86 n=1 Tax=Zygotorulaspora mrakii TaxID=42260 RepID=A0A7H9B8Q3_ZYGMR|nr:uncharacterized protein HG535_0H00710 [Zygotorulaspora mrakii]QLG74746.1 hypothetical protein HG535_0H00710 [Zygotorulaspora mrakii]